ncbi:Serine/threonine protein kinase [Trema orientale]|uniref:Serine/threonine protein kinase n=1 Tax=Trema orientale TaxID=63057 RepID=A0A2P5FLW1_TREOI|nr:Serine/threonine protein kinase [Trema orientale]
MRLDLGLDLKFSNDFGDDFELVRSVAGFWSCSGETLNGREEAQETAETWWNSAANRQHSLKFCCSCISKVASQLPPVRFQLQNKVLEAVFLPGLGIISAVKSVIFDLEKLHEKGKCHGDLKPQNVLIFFGKQMFTHLCYTGSDISGWKAPEQLLNGRQTIAADLFSLGCLLFFCFTGGSHPFGQASHPFGRAIDQRDVNILQNKMNLSQLENMPEASHLISLLLHPDPEMRPEAGELYGHPLFWDMSRRIKFLTVVCSRVNKEVNEGNYSLFRELKSNAPEVLDPEWGKRLGRFGMLFYGTSPKCYADCLDSIGPRNSFKTRLYSRLLLKLSPIMCKHCQREDGDDWSGLSIYWSDNRFFPS